jgi:hypothetical protein
VVVEAGGELGHRGAEGGEESGDLGLPAPKWAQLPAASVLGIAYSLDEAGRLEPIGYSGYRSARQADQVGQGLGRERYVSRTKQVEAFEVGDRHAESSRQMVMEHDGLGGEIPAHAMAVRPALSPSRRALRGSVRQPYLTTVPTPVPSQPGHSMAGMHIDYGTLGATSKRAPQ